MAKIKQNKKQHSAKRLEKHTETEVKMNSISANYSNNKTVFYHCLFLFTLAIIAYGNTLFNGFVLDDSLAIIGNSFTKQGFAGIADLWTHDMFVGAHGQEFELAGGRYRPLSLTIFAIEYQFFGENAFINHLTNILFFAFSGVIIYLTLKKILQQFNEWIPLIATSLFIVHPIHTEVIANIKSLDEILSLLFLMLSIYYVLSDGKKGILLSVFFYFLSLLSKENTITALAIIPLLFLFFRSKDLKTSLLKVAPHLTVAFLYLILREIYSGGFFGGHTAKNLMDNPFLGLSFFEKLPTLLVIAGKYISLLFFPYPLSYDYSYNTINWRSWSDIFALLSLVGLAVTLIFTLKTTFKKLKDNKPENIDLMSVIIFGILFYVISYSIISNFIFNIGTYLGERFLYMASLGFMLSITGIIAYLLKIEVYGKFKFNAKWAVPLLIIIPIATYATIQRNKAWKDNYTLYQTDISTVPNSARARMFLGIERLNDYYRKKDSKKLEKSIQELTIATEIYPDFYHAFYNLGLAYQAKQDHKNAIRVYERVLEIQPTHINTQFYLGMSYGQGLGQTKKAIEYMERGIKYGYKGTDAYLNLGVAYGMDGQLNKALSSFLKGIEVTPNNAQLYQNVAITYSQIGQPDKAKIYADKAKAMKSK